MTGDSDPDSAVVAALAEQVVDLDTVAPGADATDLAPLREVFAGRRVVGLGEATHGTREFFQLKHRLLRFFVEELGVPLFGLEANFSETLAVDRYVRRGEGDPEAALEGIYFWTWNTEEVLALIGWMRAFNADRPPEDRVRFYGFDAQFTRGAADAVAWILDYESAERIALWAHNDHVNRVENRSDGHSAASMGRHLARRYGDAYYALGFEFGRGAFQALDKAGDEKEGEDDDGGYELREHNLDGPLPGTVGSTFAALDRPLAFLDFRTATADPRLADWLDGEHRLHSVGATYDPERPEEYVESCVLSEAFDGLWYADETTRARPLDRDCVS